MLSLPKHLARTARGTILTIRARCFGKLSMTAFWVVSIIASRWLAHQHGVAGRDFFQNSVYLRAILGID
jgi:hypothetical protein